MAINADFWECVIFGKNGLRTILGYAYGCCFRIKKTRFWVLKNYTSVTDLGNGLG